MRLNLPSTYRLYLLQKGALSIDKNGDEVLVGLNHKESIEYAQITNESFTDESAAGRYDPQRFLDLFARHEAALPRQAEPYYLTLARFF